MMHEIMINGVLFCISEIPNGWILAAVSTGLHSRRFDFDI
jgi:hypothetical protein